MSRFTRSLSLVFAIIMLVCAVSCSDGGTKVPADTAPVVTEAPEGPAVFAVSDGCSFSKASYDGVNIIYECEVTLENRGDTDESVNVTAVFDREKEHGILVDAKCIGENLLGSRVFTVAAGQKLTSYIRFKAPKVPDYFGEDIKENHKFPKVEITRAAVAE